MRHKPLFKTMFVALLALGALAAGPVAARTCTLQLIAGNSPITVGQSYGLSVTFERGVDFGPPPPARYPYQVIFHGTRNGVWDTGSGEHLMNVINNSTSTIWGYNPGGIPGQYMRYAEIRMWNGQWMCNTNAIFVNLL
jgi:hypothetical protein